MFILLHQEATIEQTLFILQKDTSFSGLFSPKCLRQFGLLLVGFSKRLDGCAMTRDLLLEFDPLDRQFDPKNHCLRFFYVSAKRQNSDQLKFPSSSDLFRQHVGHHYKRTLFYERESIILVFIACWLFSSFCTISKEINCCETVLHRQYWQLINSIGAFGSK